jgi:uncharacterized membrane protein YhaH (DUF805 family)
MESSMLGFIFGFHLRVGRLRYFLMTLAFGLVLAVLAIVVGGFAYRYVIIEHGSVTSLSMIPILVLVALMFWGSIFLASMRIRDIGWNPAFVIPIWYLLIAVDFYVARTMPQFAMEKGHIGTMVGASLELIASLALMFWPSTERDMSAPDASEVRMPKFEPPAIKPASVVPSAHTPAMVRKSFGRLGQ